MTQDDLLSIISIDPNICVGKPCIRGHRIWVSLILDYLAGSATIENVLEAYPSIEREDVLACIGYGAEMSRDVFVELPLSKKKEKSIADAVA
ncbi:DUF433 domain-containing protein [Chroogloeocystis siderophila]|uniref:DUF433 domain-containing protein n=1 Tax=Chroogloeocystis siderophila 5.2 s.c.1 TaxID=247279 RepID=A0A1U7HV30_9CHRO|nr:DUF433 domain-containing protein [Chroogloeocystis siderophila]OKH27446.1 hypothetical protein NIES1031_09175 [Chroogloeocystis siderophila 5.2 s.c.1]